MKFIKIQMDCIAAILQFGVSREFRDKVPVYTFLPKSPSTLYTVSMEIGKSLNFAADSLVHLRFLSTAGIVHIKERIQIGSTRVFGHFAKHRVVISFA